MLLFCCKNCRGGNRQLQCRPPSPLQKETALSIWRQPWEWYMYRLRWFPERYRFPRGHKAKRLFQRQLKWRTREVDDIMATLEQKPLHIPTSVLSWACADDSCHEHWQYSLYLISCVSVVYLLVITMCWSEIWMSRQIRYNFWAITINRDHVWSTFQWDEILEQMLYLVQWQNTISMPCQVECGSKAVFTTFTP